MAQHTDINALVGSSSSGGGGISVTTGISDIEFLNNQIEDLKKEIEGLKKLVISHENELKERKKISNTYIDAILSKIEILRNIVKKNIGDDDTFISQHLIIIDSIENQIKSTGKISDKQFALLNDIYDKEKRV